MAQTRAQIDKFLTNASRGYFPEGFIADKVLPVVSSKQNSGKLANYGKNHLRIINTVMGGRGKAPRFESMVRSSDSYFIEDHGLEGLVTADDYRNVEAPYDAEKDEVLGLTTVLKLGRERALATVLSDTGTLSQNTTLSGVSQFNDYVNSDPLGKFKTAQETVYDGCGLPPNTAIMSWKVANTLSYHPGILEALGFTMNRAGTLKEAELAAAMKVDRVLVGAPKYNSAALGQTASLADVWNKDVVMGFLPQSAVKYQVSAGYQVRRLGESPFQVSKWVENNPRGATGVLVTDAYDDVLTDVTALYLINDAIA